MQIFFVRHARTGANEMGLYAGGGLDVPVSESGRAEALRIAASEEFRAPFREAFAGRLVPLVYTSPMLRTRETASILFPGAEQRPVEDLREFRFGKFEGRNYAGLRDDPEYIAWTSGNASSRCPPNGDSVNTCTERVSAAFAKIAAERFAAKDQSPIVIVAHGGTAMAFLHAFIDRSRPFFSWETPNCGVWRFDCAQGKDTGFRLTLLQAPPAEGRPLRMLYGVSNE
jgi:alpha-ribazole phosphatase